MKKIIRDISEDNISSFLNAMPLFIQEYEQLRVERDIDFQAQTLKEKIKELHDKHCPMKSKTVSYKSFIKPWLSRDLLNSINYKHLLFKKYKLGIIPFEVYRDYYNSVSKVVKKLSLNTIRED